MANRKVNRSFIGTGWGFPPTFLKEEKAVGLVADEEDIRQSLAILLATTQGERIMRPEYGCNLHNLMFDSLNTGTRTYIEDLIKTAILRHEPRVSLNSIVFDTSNYLEGYVNIEIDYTIRDTNTRSNLVYPFYLEEATNR